MNGSEILSFEDAQKFLKIDYEDSWIKELIEIAFDTISDAVDDFKEKLVSPKFKRKLKLTMLGTMANMYDHRELTTDKEERLSFVNQVMLLQLKYGTYSENDE